MDATKTWAAKTQLIEDEPSPFFAIEKQQGAQAIMIDFEFENGNRLALPYSYMTRINYNLSEGILLKWGETGVMVVGRNLQNLYKHLVTHRVNFIRESIGEIERQESGDYTLYIEKLEYEEF